MDQTTACTDQWIAPLQPALPGLTDQHIARLSRLEADLAEILAATPTNGMRVSARLLVVRRRLAERVRAGHASGDTTQTKAMTDALAGFICGFHDLDLRDAVGPGHGRMILRYGAESARLRWKARIGGR
jgi:hypothetical protein